MLLIVCTQYMIAAFIVKGKVLITQSCPTLCNPIDGLLPGSSVHGIFQARVLEWGAIAFSTKMQYLDAITKMTE